MNAISHDGVAPRVQIIGGSAIISDDGLYRYELTRKLAGGTGATLGVFMVNPSKAAIELNDPTIMKVCGFAARAGYTNVGVGNKFAWRDTDVKGLRKACDPVGPNNDKHLLDLMERSDFVLFAWGSLNKLPEALRKRWRVLADLADRCGKPPYCLGTCGDGHPRHPLMVGYDVPFTRWKQP